MLRNSTSSWGWPAKALHWIGALAILVLLCHGWWMTHLAPRPDRLVNYTWHAALGYDLLALTVLRLLWRWGNPVPALPRDLKRWEVLSAQLGHIGLYLLMLAATLTGWALAGTFRSPMNKDLLGIALPSLVGGPQSGLHGLFEKSHEILSYALAIIVIVHVAGALRHHLVKRNDVLRRMVR
jgi:cytochrome b561